MTTIATHDNRAEQVREWYKRERFRCKDFRKKLEDVVAPLLDSEDVGTVVFTSRTKSVESLVAKACRPDPVDPTRYKYDDPRLEITDLVGFRIVVPLSTDVPPIVRLLSNALGAWVSNTPGRLRRSV